MRFEVPQFIEIEDKIIGPLTWRQFVYLAGGAGALIVIFFTSPSFLIFAVVGAPIGGLSVALAFHRINNRAFSIFLESFVTYFSKAKLYLWRKEKEQTIVYKTEAIDLPASTLSYTHRGSLSSLSNKLEHRIQETSL